MSLKSSGDSSKGLDTGVGMTKQSFKDESDINNILKQFYKTGQVPMNKFNAPGQNGDLSGAVDFHTALGIVRKSERMFAELSAEVRKRFDNDPGKFLEFMEDAKNKDEAVALGLVKPQRAPVPAIKVEVVNQPEVVDLPDQTAEIKKGKSGK